MTTRQDFQLHYVNIEDTPTVMRRLAAAGITTREACGNSVRNVTACPYAGVCTDETFDVTPYSRALSKFLLGHPDTQNFGRKFKHSFSGCAQHACGLAKMHDMGMIAATRTENGKQERGFEVYVGGGLGAVPYQAKLFDAFVPTTELLPLAQAIGRVFARLGEKKNRSRARIKFLVQDLGIEKFRELVLEERKTLADDPRWTEYVADAEQSQETALRPGPEAAASAVRAGRLCALARDQYTCAETRGLRRRLRWRCRSGILRPTNCARLADISRRFTKETIRTTVEQNFVVRWVGQGDLPEVYRALRAVGLGDAGASRLTDIVTCPGTDTCKLGISSSRGLAAELRHQLDPARRLSLGSSPWTSCISRSAGCFNSCGQHHVADLNGLLWREPQNVRVRGAALPSGPRRRVGK